MNWAVDCVVNHLLEQVLTPTDADNYIYPSNIADITDKYVKSINGFCSKLEPNFKTINSPVFTDADRIKKMSHLEIYSILSKIPRPVIKVGGVGIPSSWSESSQGDADVIIEGAGYCRGSKSGVKLNGDILSKGGGPKGGDEIQEGDGSIYREGDLEERGKEWAKAFARAAMSSKMAGNAPAGLLVALSELLKSQVPWNSYLKQLIINGIGKTIISTWSVPSRKTVDLPGLKYFTRPKMHIKIDTSGSIDRETLKQFLGEVFSLAHQSELRINFWDANVYESISVRNPGDVVNRAMKMVRGGGGTCIKPALTQTIKEFKRGDILIVFTDGYIYDLDKCKSELTKLTNVSSQFIWVYTGQENKLSPRIRQIKVVPKI